MEDGVRSAYQPPPLEDVRLKRVAPIVVPKEALELLLESDSCYQNLRKEEAKLLALPIPTEAECRAQWEKVVEAYWIWIHMDMRRPEIQALLDAIRAKMDLRKVEVRKTATAQKIHAIRQKLGRRFMAHNPKGSGLHVVARPSPSMIAPAPSSSPTETTSSPPPPSTSAPTV